MSETIIDLTNWIDCTLPVELHQLTAAQREIAEQWDKVMRSNGYAVLVNHGIDESIFEKVNSDSLQFFHQPMEEKMSFSRGVYGHPKGGYTPMGKEAVAASMGDEEVISNAHLKRDPVENFVFTSNPNNFECPTTGNIGSPIPSVGDYFERMEKLLTTLHHLSAAALNLHDLRFFDRFYDPTLPANSDKGVNGNALRLAHYLPGDNTNSARDTSQDENDLSYGAHTDYQGLTILRADKRDWHSVTVEGVEAPVQFGGLQVYSPSHTLWLPVKIPMNMNCLIVNVGDLFQRWTNDRWPSPIHRVTRPSCPVERQAIVFFSGPLSLCEIEPILTNEHETSRYSPIRCGDHLQMKLQRSNT